MIYKTASFKLFDGDGGGSIYFNEETLEVLEIPSAYISILKEFTKGRTKQDVLERCAESDVSEIIDELIDMGIIVNNAGEKNLLKNFNIHPQVSAFRIVLTETCNLSCVECFVTKNRKKLNTMSSEVLDRVIRQTIPYGQSISLKYHFFGGEPILRFDHIKRAVAIIRDAVEKGEMLQPVYMITTNGTMITEEIVQFFKKHNFRVGVSVDGPIHINDKLRVYHNGRGTFQDIIRSYTQMLKAGVEVHTLITPHPDYLNSLPTILRGVLEEFPMKKVTINTPFNYNTLKWSVRGDWFAEILIELIRVAQKLGVEVDSAASPLLAAISNEVCRESPCAFFSDNVMTSVDTEGNMSFCAQKWHPNLSVPLGTDKSAFTIPVQREDSCQACEARNICGGPCPAYQKISKESIDLNKCLFMRTMLKEIVSNLEMFEE